MQLAGAEAPAYNADAGSAAFCPFTKIPTQWRDNNQRLKKKEELGVMDNALSLHPMKHTLLPIHVSASFTDLGKVAACQNHWAMHWGRIYRQDMYSIYSNPCLFPSL